MLRTSLGSLVVLVLCLGVLLGSDKDDKQGKDKHKGHHRRATITKVDPEHHTVTVRMKNRQGKEEERTFRLAEDIRYLDSTGRVAAVDVFRSGDEVLVVEREGRLVEMKQHNKGQHAGTKSGQKPGEKSGGSSGDKSGEKSGGK
jgi:hypothetical protein